MIAGLGDDGYQQAVPARRHSIKEITPDEAAQIVNLYNEKKALKEIRVAVNVTDGVIYQALRRFGIKPQRMIPHKRGKKRETAVSGEHNGSEGRFDLPGGVTLVLNGCTVVGMQQEKEGLVVTVKG